jgi:microcystin-dependent protein
MKVKFYSLNLKKILIMDSPFIGQIQAFGFNFAPRGWMTCAGQAISISQNTALFSLLGTTYGGNGQTTFQLPDLQGRVAVGQGNGPGLSAYVIGQKAGSENTQLSIANMPAHTHLATFTSGGGGSAPTITASLKASTLAATSNVPGTGGATTLGAPQFSNAARVVQTVPAYVVDAAPTVALTGLSVAITGGSVGSGTVTNAPTGNGVPFSNLSPYLCINYSIAIQGLFPSRN